MIIKSEPQEAPNPYHTLAVWISEQGNTMLGK